MHTVAIIGRPNVGKSTLFNRLTESRKAIVDDTSGVTRDRLYGQAEWNGFEFNVIDTGGFVQHSDDVFEAAIREQVDIAIQEASLLVFLVDVTTGMTDLDQQMADKLRKTEKPVFLVVNKVDNSTRELEATEFYSLGIEHTYFVSAMTGSGTGDFLDPMIQTLKDLPAPRTYLDDPDMPKFAIIGQPNVGKSSLVNALIGEKRNIVTEIAGTTRDSLNSVYKSYGKNFVLVDTAGLRKKSKVHENLEFYSVIRAIKAIDQADVCMLVLDATEGIEGQDLKILKVVERKRKGIVILVNKWDAVEKDQDSTRKFEKAIKQRIAPFTDIPIIFISALEKIRIFKAIETAIEIHKKRQQKIPTSKLNEVMQAAIQKHPPPSTKGKYIKIKYVTQLPTPHPVFAFFCNLPQYIKDPYKQYLENQLRSNFDFSGVPISLAFRKK